jgi:hypothetical protein
VKNLKQNSWCPKRDSNWDAPYIFSYYYYWGGTFGTVANTGLMYQPRMIGDGVCEEIGGMKVGRGNRSTRRKPAPAPLCPPQMPHD